ncbi:hypothetical protein ACOME3_003980 [Neoechinorhynchus agilis]
MSLSRISRNCCSPNLLLLTFQREKRSVGGGTTRNTIRRRIAKLRNIYVSDGEHVNSGQVLAKQRNLVFYPGENTRLLRDYTIESLLPGRVYITFEQLTPYPESPLYKYAKIRGLPLKKFISVIPKDRDNLFRLIDIN